MDNLIYMPCTYLNEIIKAHLLKNVSQNVKILDVDGCGTYSNLLKSDFKNIDVVNENVLEFDISEYDYIILDNIIQHMTYEDAKGVIDKIRKTDQLCLVGVQYNFEQSAQPNLTEALFLERYTNMSLLIGNDEYGYFVNYEFEL